MSKKAIVISASSDIGTAMCQRWKTRGWGVFGTYRTESSAVKKLGDIGVECVFCDLAVKNSLQQACRSLRTLCSKWDILVLCPGVQEPVGEFTECDIDEWESSIAVNFTRQLRIVHELLPARNEKSELGALVLFFAGGGTNNAPPNYSAYIASKIALIKMCELLDAEVADTRFVILGPGWVRTKIHESTLKAGMQAGRNYQRTVEKLAGDECTPMEKVLDCCDWIIESPRELISGRNFSVVYDKWNSEELAQLLLADGNMYKLRRHGNEIIIK